MAQATQILRHKDERTGKNYALQITSDTPVANATKQMIEMAEHDYQKSLPPHKRAVANKPIDFKCPKCKTHQEPIVRKEKMTSGFLFWIRSYLVDVYNCINCKNDFTNQELNHEKSMVMDSNWRAKCLEMYQDGQISEHVWNYSNKL